MFGNSEQIFKERVKKFKTNNLMKFFLYFGNKLRKQLYNRNFSANVRKIIKQSVVGKL